MSPTTGSLEVVAAVLACAFVVMCVVAFAGLFRHAR
jgi:hypothetical protein